MMQVAASITQDFDIWTAPKIPTSKISGSVKARKGSANQGEFEMRNGPRNGE
jgi:hypothetical protein